MRLTIHSGLFRTISALVLVGGAFVYATSFHSSQTSRNSSLRSVTLVADGGAPPPPPHTPTPNVAVSLGSYEAILVADGGAPPPPPHQLVPTPKKA
jgi:hypothetical protein